LNRRNPEPLKDGAAHYHKKTIKTATKRTIAQEKGVNQKPKEEMQE
jgi:hypothetical protein